ncbi:MAG: alpha/beta hydrolase [Actinobacteria bacterium]|nr:alpha/beta hydrolase [Actinomycetota bacterium]
MVLIHGVGSWWRVWEPVLDAIAAERDAIALDLPGFGDSPPLPAGTAPTVPALTGAVASLLEELEVERPLVVGNSLGGWIALELAKRGIPRAVVASSPAGFWSGAEVVWLRAQLRLAAFSARRMPGVAERAARSARGRRLTSGVFYGHPERVPAGAAIAALRNLARSPAFDSTVDAMSRARFEAGHEVKAPVTIAWGELDRLLFPRQARRALEHLPRARYISLAGAGHVPTWDVPEQLVRLLLAA